jgi:hypothetical protein
MRTTLCALTNEGGAPKNTGRLAGILVFLALTSKWGLLDDR